MSRRIDQIQDIFIPVLCLVDKTGCLQFYGNAPFPFQLHVVQELFLHLPLGNQAGLFNDPVRQSRFSMVDVGNNAEIPNVFLIFAHRFLSLFCKFLSILLETHSEFKTLPHYRSISPVNPKKETVRFPPAVF